MTKTKSLLGKPRADVVQIRVFSEGGELESAGNGDLILFHESTVSRLAQFRGLLCGRMPFIKKSRLKTASSYASCRDAIDERIDRGLEGRVRVESLEGGDQRPRCRIAKRI
jgi:hypothetical protein